jgi:hypothetical protein
MAKFNLFSAENLLMSVCGHLVVCAIMVTSFVVVLERARLVAPDRIQIMEIDLNQVVVSGEETKLYNVGQVAEQKEEEQKTVPDAKPDAKPDVDSEEVEEIKIETPTLIEEKKPEPEEVVEEKKEEKKPEEKKTEASKPVEPAPAPKKKKVVRVNREVLSLDRTLTVSVVDALRVAMTRCWVVDNTRPDIADIRAVAHMKLRRNGTVQDLWFESAARAETDASFAYILETIKDAIDTCQPFRMLPPSEYEKWKDVQLTFYPSQGKVM